MNLPCRLGNIIQCRAVNACLYRKVVVIFLAPYYTKWNHNYSSITFSISLELIWIPDNNITWERKEIWRYGLFDSLIWNFFLCWITCCLSGLLYTQSPMGHHWIDLLGFTDFFSLQINLFYILFIYFIRIPLLCWSFATHG